jgi:hypothetical protein
LKVVGPLARLAAVERSLSSVPAPAPGETLEVVERWMAATATRLGEACVAEAGFVTYCHAQVQLMMGGLLARKEDGGARPYRERSSLARSLQRQVCEALEVARRRVLERVRALEQVAEAGIRAAAEARVLAAPGGRPRAAWLADMTQRMADHPHCAPHLARLGLCLPEPELLELLDRVFARVFGV